MTEPDTVVPADVADRRAVLAARGLVAAGAVILSLGAGMVYRPAGIIVAGLLLLTIGLGALRQ